MQFYFILKDFVGLVWNWNMENDIVNYETIFIFYFFQQKWNHFYYASLETFDALCIHRPQM